MLDVTAISVASTNISLVSLCLFNSMLADKLNMSPEEAERWIVNLIRNARLDAKIDSKLVRPSVSVYQLAPYLTALFKSHVIMTSDGALIRGSFLETWEW